MNLLSETRERALLLRECKDSGATIRIAIYIDLLDANRNSKCARTDGDIPNERWSQKFHAVANAPLVAVDESPPHSGVGTTEEKTHFHLIQSCTQFIMLPKSNRFSIRKTTFFIKKLKSING